MVSVLEREVFSEAEAARLLRVAQSTLHYWLEGDERKGRRHKPVLRTEPRGARSVTWAEFVEAGLLREYRRTHRVPMVELRAFIDLLREDSGCPTHSPTADRASSPASAPTSPIPATLARSSTNANAPRVPSRCLAEPRPFIYAATRTTMRQIPLT
ncbi:hypothetical protein O7543_27235 [Solwaraspora sp. WMMA2080]|uniref:hypothetical protein n=1 Tax=unclassified Solwaraspora TaxID=2627926 RepID=UPI00248CC3E3|nr:MULTISPECIES: hypothetical protein [unclassified Solwaraspora]WBB95669.1 hypothetical protein O7553_20145 [Solwaraspora sp. WMMA2059]WBC20428.1 hypothetical protein O7543_27235 [Solwaraspora sp. WMMA2080]